MKTAPPTCVARFLLPEPGGISQRDQDAFERSDFRDNKAAAQ